MQIDDPGELTFRPRRNRGSRQRTSRNQTVWWVIAVIAAVAFVLMIRVLLDRTAWTAGRSTPQEPGASAQVATQGDEPAPASRQDYAVPMVYRCVDRKGAVSLQSQPCAPGQRTTRAIAAPPDVEPIRYRTTASVTASRPSFQPSVPAVPDYQRQQRLAACAGAKAQRERILASVGLRRTYDLLQRLDESVRELCKGV